MIRGSAVLLWFTAAGFGIPCLAAIWSVAAGRGIVYMFGLPTYGDGPFERHGIHSTVLLLSGFFAVCALEAVAGLLLWNGNRAGAFLSVALIPAGAAYWWGFALPFPPFFAIARTVLIILGWPSLR